MSDTEALAGTVTGNEVDGVPKQSTSDEDVKKQDISATGSGSKKKGGKAKAKPKNIPFTGGPGDRVWAKWSSSWWPAEVCDPAAVSTTVHVKEGMVLVMFFQSHDFMVYAPSKLQPFQEAFDHLAKSSKSKRFLEAVKECQDSSISAVELFPPKGSDAEDETAPLEIADGDEDEIWDLFSAEGQSKAAPKSTKSRKRNTPAQPKKRPAKRARTAAKESSDENAGEDLDGALEDLDGIDDLMEDGKREQDESDKDNADSVDMSDVDENEDDSNKEPAKSTKKAVRQGKAAMADGDDDTVDNDGPTANANDADRPTDNDEDENDEDDEDDEEAIPDDPEEEDDDWQPTKKKPAAKNPKKSTKESDSSKPAGTGGKSDANADQDTTVVSITGKPAAGSADGKSDDAGESEDEDTKAERLKEKKRKLDEKLRLKIEKKKREKLDAKRQQKRERDNTKKESPVATLKSTVLALKRSLVTGTVSIPDAVTHLKTLASLSVTVSMLQNNIDCVETVKKCRKFNDEAVQTASKDVWKKWKTLMVQG
eukprot:m.60980 g.60980  ORF g.60980 m.60980 type:complete len:538 (+) comp15743_c0_seq2:96-1709(+)